MDTVLRSSSLDELPLYEVDPEYFHTKMSSQRQREPPFYNIISSQVMKEVRKQIGRRDLSCDLEAFLSLPLDLIYEIFGHLHPIDLYHIAQVNKALWKIIQSRNAVTVWRLCFLRNPSIPCCPSDMAEPQCAALLFGPSDCDNCSIGSALPDFTYRKRLCTACLRIIQVPRPSPTNNAPIYPPDHPVWDLVPASNGANYRGVHSFDVARRRGLYQRAGLHEMTRKLEELQIEDPDAVSSFKAMIENCTVKIMKHAERCNQWALAIHLSIDVENYQKGLKMENRIKDRMTRAGFDMREFNWANINQIFLNHYPRIHRLTRKAWRELRPLIEEEILRAKQMKLAAARYWLLYARGQVIKCAYMSYQKNLAPKTWNLLPRYEDLLNYDAFSTLVNDPSDGTLTVDVCKSAISMLPEYLQQWRQERKAHLRAQLSEILDGFSNFQTIDKADLATSVFTCDGCILRSSSACLFGWGGVLEHLHCEISVRRSGKNFIANRVGITIASAVISFLGFDPLAATVSDLDRTDARLLCSNCPVLPYRGVKGRKAYTWREYVAHVIQMKMDKNHVKNSCDLLTTEATQITRLHEDPYPCGMDVAWSCMHCSAHFFEFVSRRRAIKHVVEEHSVSSPTEGNDFFRYTGVEAEHTPRRPIGFSEDPPAEFVCAICPSNGKRLYQRKRLNQHLIDKHEIDEPVLNEHFIILKLLLRSMPPVWINSP